MWWSSLPLRTRLALGYSVFFAVTLALLTAGVFFVVQSSLRQEIADQLQNSGDLIQEDFDLSNTSLELYFADPSFFFRSHAARIEGLDAPSLYVQALAPDGTILVRSANVQSQTLPLDATTREAALAGQPQFGDALFAGAPVLLLTRPILANGLTVGLLQVAHPLREIDRTLRLLLLTLLLTDVFALLVAVRAGSWLAQRALAPVGQIAATAGQIVRAEHLSQRVPDMPTRDEIGQLSRTVNEMLSRLEQLFTAQQRFVSDVSHELRTPLTALQGNLELLRRNGSPDADELASALAEIEREAGRLIRLTNDLLALAQAEGHAPLRHEPVALDELVLEVARDMRTLASDVALTPIITEQIAMLGDRDRLKQALINLVTNALQHTPPDGRVQVALERQPGRAAIHVRDTGSGIGPEDMPHIFERFYRADRSRGRHSGGAGLGLAIVQWIAEAHGGRVSVQSEPGAGSAFTLELPLDAKASAAPAGPRPPQNR